MTEQNFSIQIDKWIKKVKEKRDLFMIEFCQDLAETVVQATPVVTGNLRANWTASIDVPNTGYKAEVGTDPLAVIALELQKATAEDTIFIVNNVPYGPYVEFGTANMAPRAFVRSAVSAAPQIADDVVRRIK